MHSPDWEEMYKQLLAAGLIVQNSAVGKLENLPSVIPIIEAANSSGVRLLNANTVDELLAISPSELENYNHSNRTLWQSSSPN